MSGAVELSQLTEAKVTVEEQAFVEAQWIYQRAKAQYERIHEQFELAYTTHRRGVEDLKQVQVDLHRPEAYIASLKEYLRIKKLYDTLALSEERARSTLLGAKQEAWVTRNTLLKAYGMEPLSHGFDIN